jgi:tetratricopeptide (TPR) repeat protein
VFRYSGRLPEAERLARQTIALLTAIYGPAHSRVGEELSHLGGIIDMEGDSVRADSVHRAAVKVLRAAYPAGSIPLAGALRNLGYNLTTRALYDEAETVWAEAADMYAKAGKHTVNYANALSQLGHAKVRHSRFLEAERTSREILSLSGPTLSPTGPVFLRSRQYLGEALLGERRYAEAEPLLLEIIRRPAATQERGAGKQVAQDLVRLYEAEGRPEQAAVFRAMATGTSPSRSK